MPALLGVKGSEGRNSAPSVGQVGRVCMGERDGGRAKIESGACEDCREISSKLCTVPVEEGGNVVKVIGEESWRPSCETTCTICQ